MVLVVCAMPACVSAWCVTCVLPAVNPQSTLSLLAMSPTTVAGVRCVVYAVFACHGWWCAMCAVFACLCPQGSALERGRARRITLVFYLEDGTVELLEPYEDNSGLRSGVFLRRQVGQAVCAGRV